MNPLLRRTISGALFLVIVVGCLATSVTFAVLSVFLITVLHSEFNRMTLQTGMYLKERVCVLIASVLLFLTAFLCRATDLEVRWMTLSFIPLAVSFLLLMKDGAEDHSFDVTLYFPLLYITLPFLSTLLIVIDGEGNYSGLELLGLFAIIWLNDIGAYAFGMSMGQKPDSRKLAPNLSPKKSWIGVIGGTIFSIAAAVALYFIFGKNSMALPHWLAVSIIVSVFSVCGDLFESLIKRHANVKDAGNIIPGHGGLMDRFDGFLFAIPAVVVYFAIFSLI